jgi:hypothetical protein
VRLRFSNVHFGAWLHGHHGLFAEAERHGTGAPVTLRFLAGGGWQTSVTHRDTDGWKPFEFGTEELRGTVSDLTVEIESTGGRDRMYCFAADTR